MEKKWKHRCCCRQWQRKFKQMMRLGMFLVVLSMMTVNAAAFSQEKVSVDVRNQSLLRVLDLLQEQSGYTFLFSSADVREVSNVTVKAENADLFDVLRLCLRGTNLEFEVNGQLVILRIRSKTVDTAQVKSMTVCGFVQDEEKQYLPGVTIKLEGTSIGAATDVNGWFYLMLPVENGRLEFSFVGYKTYTLPFAKEMDGDTLRIVLEKEIQAIDEVVVTGYQAIKEKSMAGSYSKVEMDDLVNTGTQTLETMLQGKLPGVMVMSTSGLTGTRQKVRVRGTSTLVGNAEPVWVVDGIIQEDPLPFESSALVAMNDNIDMMRDFIGGAISWLNPSDIDDITVLKDASATAIYGVKAANGVIVITTKKGERGRMSLNYSGSFTASTRMNYNRQEVMNSKERVDLSREAFKRGARMAKETVGYAPLAYDFLERKITWEEFDAAVKKLETVNTDWFDILYRTPFSQAHSISFSGGNNDATYRASLGYRNIKNTAIGNEQVSYTGNLNTSFIFWNRLTVTASLSGSRTETKAFASGVDPFSYAINTSRVISCYDENGDLFYYDDGGYRYNILNELANSGNKNTMNSLSLNVNLRWRLTEALSLSALLGGGTSNSFAETWFTERSHYISQIRGYEFGEFGVSDPEWQASQLPYGGMLTTNETRNFNYTGRLQMEYLEVMNDVHSVSLMAGVEGRSNKYDAISQTNYGYQPDRGKSFVDVTMETTSGGLNYAYARTKPTITDRIQNTFSYYATASYMYDNRYAINLSIRGDGSNRFGEQGKFLPVWSTGLRWNVTEEHWMSNQKMVNNLALTASFGYQGNAVENIGPDLVVTMESMNAWTGEYQMKWKILPNPDLKWEKTLSVNLGVNFALFNSKVNGTFNWYYKKTKDVVTSAQVPYENGTTTMYVNDGNMTNRGWDLSFSLVPVRTENFMWSLGTIFSGNDNQVKSEVQLNRDWQTAVSGEMTKEGYPVGSFWAFRFTGLNPKNGGPQFDLSGSDTEKAEEDATEYMTYVGTREPKFSLGLNMMFRWKRFSFPLSVYISTGNKEFLASPYDNGYSMMSEFKNVSNELNKRWRKPGDEKYTNIPSIPVGENCRTISTEGALGTVYPLDLWAYSDVRVVDAWYVRFSDFQLQYTLPEKWIHKFAQNVTLSATLANPLEIRSKDFKGRDPEVGLGNQPRSRDFSFGINVSF